MKTKNRKINVTTDDSRGFDGTGLVLEIGKCDNWNQITQQEAMDMVNALLVGLRKSFKRTNYRAQH